MSRPLKGLLATAAIGGLALTACSDNPSNVPAFEDIEETMWESMAASDAVAMTAVVPESLGEDVAMLEELYGGNLNDLEIYGSLTEPATAIRMGEDQDPLLYVFEDEMFVSLEMTLEAMGSFMPQELSEAERAQFDELSAQAEGKYIDMSEDFQASDQNLEMSQILDDMRSAAESGGTDEMTGFDFSQLQSEGSYMQLDMESDDTGWFYSIDGEGDTAIMNGEAEQFIGVVSDREAPRLVEIADGDTRMDFSWDDDVEIPQRPSDDQIMTEEDFLEMDPTL